MNLVSITQGSSKQEHRAEFSIGVQSCPCLADHRFQEMVVLPGTFFIAMAGTLHHQLFNENATRIEDINFLSPVILDGQDRLIGVDVLQQESFVLYRFFEATQGKDETAPAFAATLHIPLAAPRQKSADIRKLDDASFLSRAEIVFSAAQFYGSLRENGNQYGAAFQNIDSAWRSGDEVLGRISVVHQSSQACDSHTLSPMVLDSGTQLLAAFVLEQRRGFLLRSINKVEISGPPPSSHVWGRARCTSRGPNANNELAGDVDLWSDSGHWASLTGVAISTVENVGEAAETTTVFAVASNFTAEPVENSLRFWAHYAGLASEVKFAPYNQVFQQLLDSDSLFHRNRRGANRGETSPGLCRSLRGRSLPGH